MRDDGSADNMREILLNYTGAFSCRNYLLQSRLALLSRPCYYLIGP